MSTTPSTPTSVPDSAAPGSAAPDSAIPYSASLRAGDFIFIAGQVPRDGRRQIVGTTIEEQTAVVFDKLRALLEAEGASLADVVRFQVFLADIADWSRFNEEYLRQLGAHRPVRTTVGCQLNGVKVEIDATAYAPIGSR